MTILLGIVFLIVVLILLSHKIRNKRRNNLLREYDGVDRAVNNHNYPIVVNYKNQALPAGTILRGPVYTYRIEKVLGQGAFGITYLASTSMAGPLGKVTVPVALKEFFAKELDSRQMDGTVSARSEDGIAHKYAKAFQRESENLSKMEHPGIVNVLEAFEAKGTCYYSMEYLSGGSLDDKIRDGVLPEEEALPIIRKIGSALSYMHGRKMMHLDLKPRNIMLKGDGSPVIIDFGLSKQFDATGEPESTSTIGLGTPGYAPIEQANQNSDKKFQPTMDIYALGATLYKMLTGVTPPNASLVLNEGFPEEPLKHRGVSRSTIDAIKTAMAPIRKDRFQSVSSFLAGFTDDEDTIVNGFQKVKPKHELDSKLDQTPKPQFGSKPIQKSTSSVRKKNWLWALVAGLTLTVIILGIIFGVKGKLGAVATNMKTVAEKAAFGSVQVSSTPSGATIWLDGENTQKTTPVILEEVIPGSHIIKLVKDGYTDFLGVVTISSGQRANFFRMLSVKETPASGITPELASPVKGHIDEYNGHEWVDLGLSVKWATCNIGALSPSDYGSYFAWGETGLKSDYSWTTYKWCEGPRNVTKYKKTNYMTVGNKTQLDMSDDAARANWGGSWRMPTDEEWTALLANCTWTWTTKNGVYGATVTSKINGNSIFLPAAGCRNGTTLYNTESYGNYWSSSLDTDYPYRAYFVYFCSDGVRKGDFDRYRGQSVRPVTE